MEEEIKLLFEMAYLPVADVMKRYNGKDFIGVAVPLMDGIRKQVSDPTQLKKAAITLVLSFNDLLDYGKLPATEIESTANLLVNPGPMTRMIAEEAYIEFKAALDEKMKNNLE